MDKLIPKVTRPLYESLKILNKRPENYICKFVPFTSGRSKGVVPPPPTDQNFLNFMQFLGKSGKFVCWRPLPPRRSAFPPMGNPVSAPVYPFLSSCPSSILTTFVGHVQNLQTLSLLTSNWNESLKYVTSVWVLLLVAEVGTEFSLHGTGVQ